MLKDKIEYSEDSVMNGEKQIVQCSLSKNLIEFVNYQVGNVLLTLNIQNNHCNFIDFIPLVTR